jgi:hypothetical protein
MLRAPESARNQPGVPVSAILFPGGRPRQSRLNVRSEKPIDDRPSALCAAWQGAGRRLLPTDRSLDTYVSNLRRKLMKYTDRVTLQSARGSGYVLAPAPGRAPASQG